MPAAATILVVDTEITVRELTVSEVRDWVRVLESGVRETDPAGDALFEDVAFSDIVLMTDARPEFLAAQVPSVLRPLADLCKKVNPGFFRLRAVVQAAHLSQIRAILSGAPASE